VDPAKKRKIGRIKSVFTSNEVERRSVRQLIALVRSDLMAGCALLLGNMLSALRIGCEGGCCTENDGSQEPTKGIHLPSLQFRARASGKYLGLIRINTGTGTQPKIRTHVGSFKPCRIGQ
jgi:hypothetical protein